MEIKQIYTKLLELLDSNTKSKVNAYCKIDICSLNNNKILLVQLKKQNISHLIGVDHLRKIYYLSKNKTITNNQIIDLINKNVINNNWLINVKLKNKRLVKEEVEFIFQKLKYWNWFFSEINQWNDICSLVKCQKNVNKTIINTYDINYCFINIIGNFNYIMGGKIEIIEKYIFNLFIPISIQVKRVKRL